MKKSDAQKIAQRLVNVRKSVGLSQGDFAKEVANVSRRTWQDYELGTARPSGKVLETLASNGFNIQWVLTGAGPMYAKDLQHTGGGISGPIVSGDEEHDGSGNWPVNLELLEQVIGAVETWLANKSEENIPADKKAQLIVVVYEHFEAKGRTDQNSLERLLKLVTRAQNK